DDDVGHLRAGRQEVVQPRAGGQVAVVVVDEVLVQRAAEALRDRTGDLAVDDLRVDGPARVLDAHVLEDAQLPGRAVDLDGGDLRARGEGAADRVVEGRGVQARFDARGKPVGLQVGDAGGLGDGDLRLGFPDDVDLAVADPQVRLG